MKTGKAFVRITYWPKKSSFDTIKKIIEKTSSHDEETKVITYSSSDRPGHIKIPPKFVDELIRRGFGVIVVSIEK
ncbi:MAG: hypothetical protein WC870_02755 [Candidatus Paceibacterota bacterium]